VNIQRPTSNVQRPTSNAEASCEDASFRSAPDLWRFAEAAELRRVRRLQYVPPFTRRVAPLLPKRQRAGALQKLSHISRAFCVLAFLFFHTLPLRAADAPSLILAVGAAGEDEYAATFAGWAAHWSDAAKKGDVAKKTIGLDSEEKDCATKLRDAISAETKEGTEPLWLVLIGHGTATAGDAKFNLRGDDVPAAQLVEWLAPFKRPVVVVCGFSSSGAFVKPLAAPGRIVVTATRSGSEIQFARFGGYLAETIGDAAGDLDKDGQTSLLEAFVAASRKTADFYKNEGRLATEHALLDDNGDGAGTPGDWFRGVRAVKKPADSAKPDGQRAHQLHFIRSKAERELSPEARAKRDALEQELEALRARKGGMKEDEYLKAIEPILTQLAALYREAGRAKP
jgi:hypothetical protein